MLNLYIMQFYSYIVRYIQYMRTLESIKRERPISVGCNKTKKQPPKSKVKLQKSSCARKDMLDDKHIFVAKNICRSV